MLAKDLGLKVTQDPAAAISQICRKRVADIAKQTRAVNPQELLEFVAAALGTRFVEVHSTRDLVALQTQVATEEGPEFAAILDLADGDYGVTVRRHKQPAWEPPFLSVIDCRGWKAAAAYFTKWHELAHLLTLTSQRRLVFHRSQAIDPVLPKPAEERLMDRLAGELGFLDDLVRPHIRSVERVSFAAAEVLRQAICPASSKQSWLMGLVRAWPKPVLMLTAEIRLKASEQSAQASLFGAQAPIPKLRVTKTLPNTAAKECGLTVFEYWRVPENSVIHSAMVGSGNSAMEAVECLSWWMTSDGTQRPVMSVRVEARRKGDEVEALITPIE